jgi:hypothetical protein
VNPAVQEAASPVPVLALASMLADAGSASPSDRELARNVVEAIDAVDSEVLSDAYLLTEWAQQMAATLRALLAPHLPGRGGQCAGCRSRPARWPCELWRTAHRWLIELDATTGEPHDDEYIVASQ